MGKDVCYVVVTGGAPYVNALDFNTSAMVRDKLPDLIERPGNTPIKILKYPKSMKSTYSEMSEMVEKVWTQDLSIFDPDAPSEEIHISLALHMGMAPSFSSYHIETKGKKNVFKRPGTDGEYLPPQFLEDGGVWDGCPDELTPDFDFGRVMADIQEQLPEMPIELSDDAGDYFCGFQFYSSLAELYKRGESRRVAFLHIPDWTDPDSIENGAKLARQLIVSLIDQHVS